LQPMGVRAGRSRRLCLLPIELPVTRFLLLIIYTACGLALSLAVNVVSFTSIPLGENFPFPALLWGIFPAFLSVILIGRSERNKVTTDERDVDYWGLLLAGCPAALKYAFWACFAYTWLLGMVFAVRHTHESQAAWRVVSAFCMTFYAMGLAASAGAYFRGRSLQRPLR
jgi:hypothetical protein